MFQSPAAFERFYVADLEAKLDAHRMHEFGLAEELDRAGMLVAALQQENAALVDREREIVLLQVWLLLMWEEL